MNWDKLWRNFYFLPLKNSSSSWHFCSERFFIHFSFSPSVFCSISLISSKQGLRNNITDACERHDPCQHGGICISTDSGPLCECRNLEYEGTYCERGKQFIKSNNFAVVIANNSFSSGEKTFLSVAWGRCWKVECRKRLIY